MSSGAPGKVTVADAVVKIIQYFQGPNQDKIHPNHFSNIQQVVILPVRKIENEIICSRTEYVIAT